MDLSAPDTVQILRVVIPEERGSIHTITFLPITCQMFPITSENECHARNVMASVEFPSFLFRESKDYV